MPGVARSVALCVLPALTRANTCLRLSAQSCKQGLHVLSGDKASVFSGAFVSGAIVSGTVVVGTVSTALSSPGPDEFKQSARRQARPGTSPPPSTRSPAASCTRTHRARGASCIRVLCPLVNS